MIPHRSRDGFELMGVVLSTAFFVVLVLPTLLLGMLRTLAAVRGRAWRHRDRARLRYAVALAAVVVNRQASSPVFFTGAGYAVVPSSSPHKM